LRTAARDFRYAAIGSSTLDVPPHWVEPFARLAGELELPVSDAQGGMARVQAFVERIISA
jgi:hypothetical protein